MTDDPLISIDRARLREIVRETVQEEMAALSDDEWPTSREDVPEVGRITVSDSGTTGVPPEREPEDLEDALKMAREAGSAERLSDGPGE